MVASASSATVLCGLCRTELVTGRTTSCASPMRGRSGGDALLGTLVRNRHERFGANRSLLQRQLRSFSIERCQPLADMPDLSIVCAFGSEATAAVVDRQQQRLVAHGDIDFEPFIILRALDAVRQRV